MPKLAADVLIVGAGPVGMTAAAALTQQGVSCRIVDKAANPTDKSKALVVWSRTLELLDGLGLATTFVEHGLKARGASIYSGGRRMVHVETADVESPFSYPLMIPQSETERLLTEHLGGRGVLIERQVELTSFTEHADGVTGVLKHADGAEETFAAKWLIGCDGAHSAVRHILGMPFTGQAEPNDWMLADVHVEGPLAPDEVSVFWHAKGVLVAFPITPGRFRVIADLGTARTGALPELRLPEIQAKVDERGPGGLTLSDPIWLANFRINERKVTDYRRGRVLLAGDAAHIHSPAGGQGMNTGMQDAFNLAWKLALAARGEGQTEPLLSSYSVERSVVGDQVLRGAEVVTTMATLRNPVAQFLRNHVAALMTSFGFVQDKIKNALCELSINYRHGPMSVDHWPWGAGGKSAGERLPDAPLTSATSPAETSVFQSIRGNQYRLLLLPSSRDPQAVALLTAIAVNAQQAFPHVLAPHVVLKPAAAPHVGDAKVIEAAAEFSVWIDATGRLHEQLGVADRSLILVRPDGYIGFRCQPAEGAALLEYLGRYLVRKN